MDAYWMDIHPLGTLISTLWVVGPKSHFYPYGQYETGFREEKLRKWAGGNILNKEKIPNSFI